MNNNIFVWYNGLKFYRIGANVTILPGVTIEDGVVIGAGSVVTKDCKSNTLYAGVPAKEIRNLG